MAQFNAEDYIQFDEESEQYRVDHEALHRFNNERMKHDCQANTIIVRRLQTNGVWIAQSVCQKCGARHAVKKTSVQNFDNLPMFDSIEKKLDDIYEQRSQDRARYFDRVHNLAQSKNALARLENNDQWWSEYQAYLKSDKWLNKRTKVLVRDDYQCRACLSAPASQVHHKTYKHVFNEPLFDLESVCKACHDRITAMDRDNRITNEPPRIEIDYDLPF